MCEGSCTTIQLWTWGKVNKRLQFLVVGAQKSGTTALAAYLRQHPQLYIPDQKELHYFDNEHLDWHASDLDVLHRSFSAAKDGQIWGEATPISMYWNAAPERIWNYNPAIRLIVVLRNPIERAYSHWAMEHRRGNDPLSFEAAIACEEERCREDLPLQHRVFSYIDRGYYCGQLRRLWRFFGREAVLVLRHEELRHQHEKCLLATWKHLNVPGPKQSITRLERHNGSHNIPMSELARERLRRLFWHEIGQLEALLEWDCSDWLL